MILVLGLLLSGNAFAKDLYTDLITKSKTGKGDIMGYVLPWGQMSFWGATVITNLFSAIPLGVRE